MNSLKWFPRVKTLQPRGLFGQHTVLQSKARLRIKAPSNRRVRYWYTQTSHYCVQQTQVQKIHSHISLCNWKFGCISMQTFQQMPISLFRIWLYRTFRSHSNTWNKCQFVFGVIRRLEARCQDDGSCRKHTFTWTGIWSASDSAVMQRQVKDDVLQEHPTPPFLPPAPVSLWSVSSFIHGRDVTRWPGYSRTEWVPGRGRCPPGFAYSNGRSQISCRRLLISTTGIRVSLPSRCCALLEIYLPPSSLHSLNPSETR